MQIFGIIAILTLSAEVYGVNGQYSIIKNELQNYLPLQISKSNFTLEDAKDLLYKKCKKVVLNGTTSPQILYENIEKAAQKLAKCAHDIANISVILEELEAARPTGDLDLVFQKYCEKKVLAGQCLTEFNEQLLICLTPAERDQNAVMMRIVTSLLDFVCYKNGDYIAVFIAEEGPECLEANMDNISNCMNATFAMYIPETTPSELPEMVMGPKQCIDLYDFEKCVLSYLENCNEVTPANIVESLFRFVRKETICQEEIDKAVAFQEPQSEPRNATSEPRNAAMVRTVFSWPIYVSALLLALNKSLKQFF